MQQFLKKFIFFLLPVFAVITLAEYLLRKIPNDYSLKEDSYTKHAENFETLILGNSHAIYDLNPAFFKGNTFNGGHVAQTLDLDAAIFKTFQPRLTKLKYLIIPISDMSLFFRLETSGENWRIKNYSIYYHLYTTNRIADYSEVLSLPFSINRNRLITWYIRKDSNSTITSLGYGTNYNSKFNRDLDSSGRETAKVHKVKNFKDFPIEKRSLEQIIASCAKNKIRVILFTPPAYFTYTSGIDPAQLRITIHTCDSLAAACKNVYYYNLLNDPSFTAVDFFDADHLNEKGARKLSLMIDSMRIHLPARSSW